MQAFDGVASHLYPDYIVTQGLTISNHHTSRAQARARCTSYIVAPVDNLRPISRPRLTGARAGPNPASAEDRMYRSNGPGRRERLHNVMRIRY